MPEKKPVQEQPEPSKPDRLTKLRELSDLCTTMGNSYLILAEGQKRQERLNQAEEVYWKGFTLSMEASELSKGEETDIAGIDHCWNNLRCLYIMRNSCLTKSSISSNGSGNI